MARGGYRGGGRPAGSPNKTTANAREAIARFVDKNTEKFEGWLDEIHAKEGADAAFKAVVSLLEYHVPKLARHEQTGSIEVVTREIKMDLSGGSRADNV